MSSLGREGAGPAALELLKKAPSRQTIRHTLQLVIEPGAPSQLQCRGEWPTRFVSSGGGGGSGGGGSGDDGVGGGGWAIASTDAPASVVLPVPTLALQLTDEFGNDVTSAPAAQAPLSVRLITPSGGAASDNSEIAPPAAAFATPPSGLQLRAGRLTWADLVGHLALTDGGRTGTYALEMSLLLPAAAAAAAAPAQLDVRHRFVYVDPAQSQKEQQELEALKRLLEGLQREEPRRKRSTAEARKSLELTKRRRDEKAAEQESAAEAARSKRQCLEQLSTAAELRDAQAELGRFWSAPPKLHISTAAGQLRGVLTQRAPVVTLTLEGDESREYTEAELEAMGTVEVDTGDGAHSVRIVVRPLTPPPGEAADPHRKGVYTEHRAGSDTWQRRGDGVLATRADDVALQRAVQPQATLCHTAEANDGRVSALLMAWFGGDVAMLRSDAAPDELARAVALLLRTFGRPPSASASDSASGSGSGSASALAASAAAPLGFVRGAPDSLSAGMELDALTKLLRVRGSVLPPDAAASRAAYLANLVVLPDGDDGDALRRALARTFGETVVLLAPNATAADLTAYAFTHDVDDVVLLGPHDVAVASTAAVAAGAAPPFRAILRGASTSIARVSEQRGSLDSCALASLAELESAVAFGSAGGGGSASGGGAGGGSSDADGGPTQSTAPVRRVATATDAEGADAVLLDPSLTQALAATAAGQVCLEVVRVHHEHSAAASRAARLAQHELPPLHKAVDTAQAAFDDALATEREESTRLENCRKRCCDLEMAQAGAEHGPKHVFKPAPDALCGPGPSGAAALLSPATAGTTQRRVSARRPAS